MKKLLALTGVVAMICFSIYMERHYGNPPALIVNFAAPLPNLVRIDGAFSIVDIAPNIKDCGDAGICILEGRTHDDHMQQGKGWTVNCIRVDFEKKIIAPNRGAECIQKSAPRVSLQGM